MTNLVKSLRKKGKYLDEDLIAFILYETLKVDILKSVEVRICCLGLATGHYSMLL